MPYMHSFPPVAITERLKTGGNTVSYKRVILLQSTHADFRRIDLNLLFA